MEQQLTTADDNTTIDLPSAESERPAVLMADQAQSTGSLIGRILRGRYVVLARLGSGGKGSVYKALDRYRAYLPEPQQYVAIKILHGAVANRDEQLASLRSEFYRTQILSHRNIVNVFELDRDEDVDFFTMELLEGELLSSVMLRLHPLPISRPQAWEIIREIGSGLECAHAHNIVHADLKPNNIMITDSGEVRILDFGSSSLSTDKSQEGRLPAGGASSSLTPAYACCELLEGRAPDPRDDIYALSCLSYELLTGAHPFQRRRATEARDYGIVPTRPQRLSRRQWQALTMGLSWHRARRSTSMRAWLEKLNIGRDAEPLPPARQLKSAAVKPPFLQAYPATALGGILLMCAIAWYTIAGHAGGKIHGIGSVSVVGSSAQLNGSVGPTRDGAGLPVASAALDALPKASEVDARLQASETPSQLSNSERVNADHPKLPAGPAKHPFVFAGDYTVRAGERFAEIRIRRSSHTASDTPLLWWTEAASAKPGIDYVPQSKAFQFFPKGRDSTSFFVKLLPTAFRTRPEVFYIAVAAPGHAASGQVVRAAVWLPTNNDQSQMPLKADTSASAVKGESER